MYVIIIVLIITMMYIYRDDIKKIINGDTASVPVGLAPIPTIQRYGGDDIHAVLGAPDLAAQIANGTGPGSANWKVLNSPAFDCDSRNPAPEDAWAWQVGQSKIDSEGLTIRKLAKNYKPGTAEAFINTNQLQDMLY